MTKIPSEMPLQDNPNDITLKSYNEDLAEYINHTPQEYLPHHAPLLRWINTTLGLLTTNANIFEIGSGTGREARYMLERGYGVTCSDSAPGFVKYLLDHGLQAIRFNALRDDLPGNFALILANAVIPHFSRQDLSNVLGKFHDALPDNGLIALSAKQGQGETWISEKNVGIRYVCYWQPEDLASMISEHGFEVVFMEQGIPGDLPQHVWINLTARKISA